MKLRAFVLAGTICLGVGCSSAVSDGPGGAGGQGTGANSAGGGGAESGGGGAGAGPVECQVITLGTLRSSGPAYYEADIVENIGGPEPDVVSISFWASPTKDEWSGIQHLASPINRNFATCDTCVFVWDDDAVYFQASGTLDLGSYVVDDDSWDLRGFVTDGGLDATFVEVRVDVPTRVSTPIPGGRCFIVEMQPLEQSIPPEGWTCEDGQYGDGSCDCMCGVIDEDCTGNDGYVNNCEEEQQCDPEHAICIGTPDDWDCDPADYGAGPANGCHCGCSVRDSDCLLDPPPEIIGCAPTDRCNEDGGCVPAAWTCAVDDYATDDGCDCGCGVRDPDCPDDLKASCGRCDGEGSCSDVPCDDGGSTINPTDSSTCL